MPPRANRPTLRTSTARSLHQPQRARQVVDVLAHGHEPTGAHLGQAADVARVRGRLDERVADVERALDEPHGGTGVEEVGEVQRLDLDAVAEPGPHRAQEQLVEAEVAPDVDPEHRESLGEPGGDDLEVLLDVGGIALPEDRVGDRELRAHRPAEQRADTASARLPAQVPQGDVDAAADHRSLVVQRAAGREGLLQQPGQPVRLPDVDAAEHRRQRGLQVLDVGVEPRQVLEVRHLTDPDQAVVGVQLDDDVTAHEAGRSGDVDRGQADRADGAHAGSSSRRLSSSVRAEAPMCARSSCGATSASPAS